MKVIKRDGSEDEFDSSKIHNALEKANNAVIEKYRLTDDEINEIVKNIENEAEKSIRALNVEEIQDMVEDEINSRKKFKLGRAYSQYRFKRALLRKKNTTDDSILSVVNFNNEEIKQENSNKNPRINSVQRDYIAGEASKDLCRRYFIPEDIMRAHDEGEIHFHDLDYFLQGGMNNCGLVNLDDMLQNGTVISGVKIDRPHSFRTACNIMTQIMAQVASSQYGGQSMTLSHIAPFVDVSRQAWRKKITEEESESIWYKIFGRFKLYQKYFSKKVKKKAEKRLKDEIKDGVQTIQYQTITLMTTNGQAPFVTIFMYLNEVPEGQTRDDLVLIINEVLKQRYQGVKNEKGEYVTSAFPKLIYVAEEDNYKPGTKYYWLTKEAAKCISRRMVPDIISEKKMKEIKEGCCFPSMGCRSFLSVEPEIKDENGHPKFYGRFNQGVCTINLPHAAYSVGGDIDKFWDILDERLEKCHRALRCRHERLLGTPSDVAPILWQHGAYARLNKGETIDKLLYGGYSTMSLGYAGLYETVMCLTGKSHTDPEAVHLADNIMQIMNDKCAKWRAGENIAYSVYGTPLESTTYKFAKSLQKFGFKSNYITNSYHVNVMENIDPFNKLDFESHFQPLSPGGCISYIEASNLENNLDAILKVIEYIYLHIMYAEINTKSDYCQVCGSRKEIKIVRDENNKLIWECPECGNRDQSKMNVARRTCGYIGTNFWNQGRTEEISERFVHLDNIRDDLIKENDEFLLDSDSPKK